MKFGDLVDTRPEKGWLHLGRLGLRLVLGLQSAQPLLVDSSRKSRPMYVLFAGNDAVPSLTWRALHRVSYHVRAVVADEHDFVWSIWFLLEWFISDKTITTNCSLIAAAYVRASPINDVRDVGLYDTMWTAVRSVDDFSAQWIGVLRSWSEDTIFCWTCRPSL